ncbi:MAG: NAD(+)/NADH kinase [Spirochaetota bacterium]
METRTDSYSSTRNINVSNVLIFANGEKEQALELADRIEATLGAEGVRVHRAFSGRFAVQALQLESVDVAISLGGDGTVLSCARALAEYDIPILAVNLGQFGFITEVRQDEWYDTFHAFLDGRVGISQRLMIQIRLFRNDSCLATCIGLNEVVIAASGIPKIVNLTASTTRGRLGSYRADGLLVATPTGSTAYSAAAGGPILHPDLDAMILNPVCPFTLSNRTLVMPGHEVVRIHVDQTQRTDVVMTVDGQEIHALEADDVVEVRRSDHRAGIIESEQRSFYEVLRSKLHWSGGR